jgi:hypothetical protein
LLGDTNQARSSEPERTKSKKKEIKTSQWNEEKETRATFIVNEDLLEK